MYIDNWYNLIYQPITFPSNDRYRCRYIRSTLDGWDKHPLIETTEIKAINRFNWNFYSIRYQRLAMAITLQKFTIAANHRLFSRSILIIKLNGPWFPVGRYQLSLWSPLEMTFTVCELERSTMLFSWVNHLFLIYWAMASIAFSNVLPGIPGNITRAPHHL